jgi:hypothetical protein
VSQPREVAESLTQRVVDEFQRSGIVPPELVRHIQASAWSRGSTVTAAQVEEYTRKWVEELLATNEKKAD